MAKGDHSRSTNRQDEQMKQSQGYLTGIQQGTANQNANYNNLFWGGNPSGGAQVGGTFGYGSTVPNFSWTGSPYFSGNGTDTATPISSGFNSGGRQLGNPGDIALAYAKSLGTPSDENLARVAQYMQQQGYDVKANPGSDGFWLNGQGVDMISKYKGGDPSQRSWQFNVDSPYGGGGGSVPGMNMADYGGIMSGYANMIPQYQNLYKDLRGQFGGFLGSASNMANTGGLSEGDKSNLRSRAISPIRAVYGNTLRNVERQKALQGGYSPGYTTAMGRFNRDMGQGVSDATTNAEAAIAEMVQRGKLGGLGAWGSGLSGMSGALLGALGGQNSALGGMTGAYSATPGLSSLFGQQALASNAQQLQAAGLQNQLSLGLMGNQNQISNIPGNFQSAMGNIGSALGVGGQVAGLMYPWLGGGGYGMGSTPVGANVNPNTMFTPSAYGG